ncbi:hypothetical protein LGM90_17890 [Burkholderia sp. AU28942]|uniref:hypothetical protein n=1 Tax=Burkholderia TaxID=32008 RepID=UPI0012EA0091|nr:MULTISPECIES: hypothetical protein [Burkholderia]MCA8310382.1 hypothetical protein [Burkholderia sp. AU28942]
MRPETGRKRHGRRRQASRRATCRRVSGGVAVRGVRAAVYTGGDRIDAVAHAHPDTSPLVRGEACGVNGALLANPNAMKAPPKSGYIVAIRIRRRFIWSTN